MSIADHDHQGSGGERRIFSPPTLGRERTETDVDHGLIARLYDAAFAECSSCRTDLLDRVALDASTMAGLARWVCVAAGETYGTFAIPSSLMADSPLQILDHAYCEQWPDDIYRGMSACSRTMTSEQRRAAAENAIDIVISLDPFGQPGLDEEDADGPIIVATAESITVFPPDPTKSARDR
ncbi:hypothetical protein [Streptomyces sp. NPDC004230]